LHASEIGGLEIPPPCYVHVFTTSPPSGLTRRILVHGVIALKLFNFGPFIGKSYHNFTDIANSCINSVEIRYMHFCFSFSACQNEKQNFRM
jgi:hypothetical protein